MTVSDLKLLPHTFLVLEELVEDEQWLLNGRLIID
jgi:hypothetical protein